uniref:hypothetical protein n=1 Tax=Hymenobacter terricola TaxID=2819236 RepID=UPI001B30A16D|nr:hypothetical protein [Hymenobacter terricola]
MTEQTVAIDCFIDDLLTQCRPAWAPAPDPRQHLTDAQVLTTALVAARYFGGNLAQARRCMQAHWGQRPLHKSGFSRQLHRLQQELTEAVAIHAKQERYEEAANLIWLKSALENGYDKLRRA